jgi:hypothetical protein
MQQAEFSIRENYDKLIPKKKAKIYAQALLEIKEKYGILRPSDVVNEAKKHSSPLHNFFEWNEKKAAESFRLWQARYLIGAIEIKVAYHPEQNGKLFNNVKIHNIGKAYVTREEVLGNKDFYEQTLKTAYQKFLYYKEQYMHFKELHPIFDAINEVGKKIK